MTPSEIPIVQTMTAVPAPIEPVMPTGPWVLVVGMHRSGTSAVTGALGHLGLAVPMPEDRYGYYVPTEDNPEHWESRAMGSLDEALLERLGGTWDRPPDRESGWESDPVLAIEDLGDPAAAASVAFPNDGPIVWKDPRSCLLLPYWLAHLPSPVAAVFIWRSPLSVARSLQARDGLHLADGVALWERYNRSGLNGLVGVDTFVIRYESIVEDPLGRLSELAHWLGDLPQFAAHTTQWDVARAAASISPQLLRQTPSDDPDLLLDEQRELVEHLETLEGPHNPLTSISMGAESQWTTALMGDRQQLAALSLQRDALQRTLAEHKIMAHQQAEELKWLNHDLEGARAELATLHELYERMQASTSWRVTRPLRQVAALRDRSTPKPGP
jgi:hypothetical protein